MPSIFLSYSFVNQEHPLVIAMRSIIEAVGFRVIDGKILDSGTVAEGVKEKQLTLQLQ